MNFDQPPKPSWVKVVAWIAVCVGVLLIALVIGAYYAVMHTSLPFKFLEAMLSSGNGNQDFKVEGISGSIAKGFVIQRISWAGKDGEPSEIRDVKVAYSGFWDLIGGKKVIFKDIHIGKAHLDVTGIEQFASEMNGRGNRFGTNDDDEPDLSAFTNNPAWTNAALQTRSYRQPATGGPDIFEIDRIGVEDVFITNRTTGFGLSMPAVVWKGFKATKTKVELGELTVDSDRLKVETHEGEPASVNGETVAFQKKLEGTVLPRLHKSVLKPIPFTVDVGYLGGKLVWRLKTFDGKMEVYRGSNENGFLRCKDADLGGYFDAAVPQHVTIEAKTSRKKDKDVVRLEKGAFRLGLNWFEIQPTEWERSAEEMKTNTVTAISHAGSATLKYELLLPQQPWAVSQRLTAQPELSPDELLARIYFGKKYAELTTNQQTVVGAKKAGFTGFDLPETSVAGGKAKSPSGTAKTNSAAPGRQAKVSPEAEVDAKK